MVTQCNQFLDELARHGWEIIDSFTPENEDWIAEELLIQSLWSPTNCHIRVIFAVDWQIINLPIQERKKHVWAAVFSLKKKFREEKHEFMNPQNDDGFTVIIRPNWKDKLKEIFIKLDKIRDKQLVK